VIVNVRVPVLVRLVVDTVSVDVLPVVELGLNDADDLVGSPLTENDTADPKPPVRFTVTV